MRARAASVNRRAATVSDEGISSKRTSFVTVPTITAVLPSLSFKNRAKRDKEIGALLMRDARSLLTMVAANLESPRLAMKLSKR